MEHLLHRGNRELAICLFLDLQGEFSGNIYGREGCIVSKGKPVCVDGLPVLETCVLLGISKKFM